MREIKFRMWDKKRGHFHWGIGNICITLGGHYMWQFGYNAPDILDRDEAKEYVLQQYTGLKDKNGKEIYEGDILLVPNHPSMSDPMGEPDFCPVVMETGAFGYQQGSMFESFVSLYGHGCDSVDEEEVIGNIYENPELLK